MMQLDRLTLGRMAKELGFVRDTLEKVCRLADVLKFMESDEFLSEAIALKGGTAINLTIFDLPRLSVDIDLDYCIGKNKPIYHIDRYIREAEEYFDDGSHIIYVNASYKDGTELGKLMHDFSVIEPDDMNFKVLAGATGYYKKDKEGIQAMCKAMEDMIADDRKEAAIRMLESGKLTNEDIAKFSGLPLEVVEELTNSLQTV